MWLLLGRLSASIWAWSLNEDVQTPSVLCAGKKKKGKHSKAFKPAPADEDDIDAILAEIGEAPSEKAAPPGDADAEAQPGEHAGTDM